MVTILPPTPGEPRRPQGPKDPGDAWVVAPDGSKFWGRFGAAGLLAIDPQRGVLLQKRVEWSHHGGTWGIPGGAMNAGESAIHGAIREAQEEAGVPDGALRLQFTNVFDLGYWSYTTVVASVEVPFEPVISDPESDALAWVPLGEVDDLPLHPGFASSWEQLRAWSANQPVIVVDAANVVGSVPNGWWKDRVGAAQRLLQDVSALLRVGVPAEDLSLPGALWFPEIVVVLEGQARGAEGEPGVGVVRADGSGDDAIVDTVAAFAGREVTVVTSDNELSERVQAHGASVRGSGWFLERLKTAVAEG